MLESAVQVLELFRCQQQLHGLAYILRQVPQEGQIASRLPQVDDFNQVLLRLLHRDALSSVEDDVLSDLERALTSIHGVSINTYMFDGAVFMSPENSLAELRLAAQDIASAWNLSVSIEVIGGNSA